jgi:four helix bundle protein
VERILAKQKEKEIYMTEKEQMYLRYDYINRVRSEFLSEPNAGYRNEKDFTSLVCWQSARELKLFLYQIILPKLPSDESYNLVNQIKRAAISITANIAEGYGRFNHKESIQYYRIARASMYELKDHLISCSDLGFIDQVTFQKGLDLIESSKIILNGYIKYVNHIRTNS